MMQKWIQLLVQRSGVALVLVFAFIAPPLPLYAAAGQSVPPAECVDDRGNAVEPRAEISDAWLLMLNFNHAPSVAVTTGCLVVRKNGSQLGYQLIECQLNNNLKQTAVGGGAATFDGYLWIECGGLGFDTTTQETFDLAAHARFDQPGNYTLMAHNQVSIAAMVDNDWHPGLASRFGQDSFTNSDYQTSARGQAVRLLSTFSEKTGSHVINGILQTPTGSVAPFTFDADQPIAIGSPGERWTLFELIIDPAGRCCR